MRIAIIGAGKMGRWFSRFFHEEGASVVVSDRDKRKLHEVREGFEVEVTTNNVEAVRNVDQVLICVPIDDLESVLDEIGHSLKREQIVMDICSVKQVSVELMHKHLKKSIVLGTHPVFGPGAKSIENQNFVLTPTTKRERESANRFGQWLKDRKANVFVMSPGKHDQLMSVVLGLPHLVGLAVGDIVLSTGKFVQAKELAGPTYRMLLTLAEAIACDDTSLSASIEMYLPGTRRMADLVLKKVEEWQRMIAQRDKAAFVRKAEPIKNRLKALDPFCAKSYEAMYRVLSEVDGKK